MSEPRQYMLMEVVGDGPRFRCNRVVCDSWLCLWGDYQAFLERMLEDGDPGKPVNVRFTFIELTDDEHAAYCEEHGIDWE